MDPWNGGYIQFSRCIILKEMAKRNGRFVYKVRQSCRICFSIGLSISDGIFTDFVLGILGAAERDAAGMLRRAQPELGRWPAA
jgi:hypothetical protein